MKVAVYYRVCTNLLISSSIISPAHFDDDIVSSDGFMILHGYKIRHNWLIYFLNEYGYTLEIIRRVTIVRDIHIRPVNLHPLFLKIGHPAFCKKQAEKNRVIFYSKRKETRLPLLFLNNNNLDFLHSVFFKKQGAQFLRIVGAD